ncbi:MAG: CocE/NonD family hydrolase [Planctomycetes bacterium]|nr:CocE/NonD family hydrolase [Planctomycetota bacterium]
MRLVPSSVSSTFLAFAAILGATLDARAADDPTKGDWVLRILEQDVGKESFEILPDGWKTIGKLDLFGKQKIEYEIVEKRGDGKTTISAKGKQDGADVTVEATLTSDQFEARVNGGPPATLDLKGKPAPFPFENLIWAYWVDVGQSLAKRVAAGTIKPGDSVDFVVIPAAKTIPLKIREFTAAQRVHDGKPLAVLTYEVTLAGTVEGTFVTSGSGVPLFFDVPAQKADMRLEGFDDVKPKAAEPRTIVDSGDWRSLLSKPEQTVVVDSKLMIPMRDKTKLAADVYRPEKDGKYPTVLVRTPYTREQMGLVYGHFYARRGYVFVTQDVRGRFASEGKFEPMRHETEDGSDTLDWIAAQPWSNGDVGMIGASYLGWVQWHAAKSGNPHLKAIIPQVAPPDPQFNIPYMGGCFVMGSVWWAFVAEDLSRIGNGKVDWMKLLATLPLTDLDKAFDLKLPFLDEWVSHPPHDSWWDPMCYQKDYSKLDVPALNISGWYDGDEPGAPMNYAAMRKSAKSERARKGQHIVMGPWTHIFNTSTRMGDFDFGSDAVVDLDSVELRWFDHYLKGIDNGVDREDPVLVFTMGENKWHREKDWPLPETQWTKLYLGGSGKANTRDGGGSLVLAPEASSSPDHFVYDPARMPDDVPDFDDLTGAGASKDLSKLPDRDDVLDFTSAPLEGPVEITGPVSAVLSVTTDAKDTDFVVVLHRIAPDGRMTAIREGIQRLRYRSGYAKEDWAKPGEVSTLSIDLWATGIQIAAGDRLRIEVGSNAFPGCARNLNTGEPDATATKMIVAHQTLFHDAAHPSYVLLPVIPRDTHGALRFTREK